MDFDPRAFRDDEIELVRAGEVADAGVGDVGGLVGRHHVVPHAHLFPTKIEEEEDRGAVEARSLGLCRTVEDW